MTLLNISYSFYYPFRDSDNQFFHMVQHYLLLYIFIAIQYYDHRVLIVIIILDIYAEIHLEKRRICKYVLV